MRSPIRIRWATAVLLLVGAATGTEAHEPGPALTVRRIAAGSCIRQDKPQPIWRAVADFAPDARRTVAAFGSADADADLLRRFAAFALA